MSRILCAYVFGFLCMIGRYQVFAARPSWIKTCGHEVAHKQWRVFQYYLEGSTVGKAYDLQCPHYDWLYRFAEVSPYGSKVFMDVGAHKGHISLLLLQLWAPQLDLSHQALYQHHKKIGRTSCGACHECHWPKPNITISNQTVSAPFRHPDGTFSKTTSQYIRSHAEGRPSMTPMAQPDTGVKPRGDVVNPSTSQQDSTKPASSQPAHKPPPVPRNVLPKSFLDTLRVPVPPPKFRRPPPRKSAPKPSSKLTTPPDDDEADYDVSKTPPLVTISKPSIAPARQSAAPKTGARTDSTKASSNTKPAVHSKASSNIKPAVRSKGEQQLAMMGTATTEQPLQGTALPSSIPQPDLGAAIPALTVGTGEVARGESSNPVPRDTDTREGDGDEDYEDDVQASKSQLPDESARQQADAESAGSMQTSNNSTYVKAVAAGADAAAQSPVTDTVKWGSNAASDEVLNPPVNITWTPVGPDELHDSLPIVFTPAERKQAAAAKAKAAAKANAAVQVAGTGAAAGGNTVRSGAGGAADGPADAPAAGAEAAQAVATLTPSTTTTPALSKTKEQEDYADDEADRGTAARQLLLSEQEIRDTVGAAFDNPGGSLPAVTQQSTPEGDNAASAPAMPMAAIATQQAVTGGDKTEQLGNTLNTEPSTLQGGVVRQPEQGAGKPDLQKLQQQIQQQMRAQQRESGAESDAPVIDLATLQDLEQLLEQRMQLAVRNNTTPVDMGLSQLDSAIAALQKVIEKNMQQLHVKGGSTSSSTNGVGAAVDAQPAAQDGATTGSTPTTPITGDLDGGNRMGKDQEPMPGTEEQQTREGPTARNHPFVDGVVQHDAAADTYTKFDHTTLPASITLHSYESSRYHARNLQLAKQIFFTGHEHQLRDISWDIHQKALLDRAGYGWGDPECFADACHVTPGDLGPGQATAGQELKPMPVSTVDEEVAKLGIQTIDVLKVDTAGHEVDVLVGARKTLRQGRVGLLVFDYGLPGPWQERMMLRRVLQMLARAGMACYFAFGDEYFRLTGCWRQEYDIHSWSSIVCVHHEHVLYDYIDSKSIASMLENHHWHDSSWTTSDGQFGFPARSMPEKGSSGASKATKDASR